MSDSVAIARDELTSLRRVYSLASAYMMGTHMRPLGSDAQRAERVLREALREHHELETRQRGELADAG